MGGLEFYQLYNFFFFIKESIIDSINELKTLIDISSQNNILVLGFK